MIVRQVGRETTKIVLKQTKNLQQYADKRFMLNEMLQVTSTSIARSLSKQLQARGMLSRYSQLLKAPHLSVDSPCSPFHQNNRTSPLALLDKGVFKAKWILPKLQSCHFLQGQRRTPMQGGYQEDSRKGKAQQQATNVPLQVRKAHWWLIDQNFC